MPTQRTLLMMVVGLAVMLSFLIGYIAGQPAREQSTVQSLENSKRVMGGNFIQKQQKNDPVLKRTGSSYSSVYTKDRGEIFVPKTSVKTEVETMVKPKFVFRKVPKAKVAYSWRRKKSVLGQNNMGNMIAKPTEQGDGYYRQHQVQEQIRQARPIIRQPVQPRYYPTPPSQSGYAMSPGSLYNNDYPVYPRTPNYYQPYGR